MNNAGLSLLSVFYLLVVGKYRQGIGKSLNDVSSVELVKN
jgi:hypothetical protein